MKANATVRHQGVLLTDKEYFEALGKIAIVQI